jgi:hypothetical protein
LLNRHIDKRLFRLKKSDIHVDGHEGDLLAYVPKLGVPPIWAGRAFLSEDAMKAAFG